MAKCGQRFGKVSLLEAGRCLRVGAQARQTARGMAAERRVAKPFPPHP